MQFVSHELSSVNDSLLIGIPTISIVTDDVESQSVQHKGVLVGSSPAVAGLPTAKTAD